MKKYLLFTLFSFLLSAILVFLFNGITFSSIAMSMDKKSDEQIFRRPSHEMLYQMMCKEKSFVSSDFRKEAATLIETIDRLHSKELADTDILIEAHENVKTWILEKTDPLYHKLTPLGERTILAALLLQVDILDRVLFIKDPESASILRKKRTLISIRNKDQRFFKDGRDLIICSILVHLEHINALQNELGAPEKLTMTFPKDVKNLSGIETDLLNKLGFIKKNAQTLNTIDK